MEKQSVPTLRDLYPHFTDEERAQAEDMLDQYLVIVLRIFDQWEAPLRDAQLTANAGALPLALPPSEVFGLIILTMQGYIGYIRVSTPKQGEGVSLEVQNGAIKRYAQGNALAIDLWLEEKETAAKQGRPIFNQAMKLLRQGKYKGIILHKLDRGARNLKDWSDLGELVDKGIDIRFVSESLDLQTRGGRLSADIQAVVAADYIRNLKEETRKGFYGRLKQGLYPLQAPLGYLDQGGGKPKTIDPIKGPLARRAFELYGTATYNFETLGKELYRLGLRNHNGGRVSKSGLSTLLNNPFYMGLIHISKTNETFVGVHEPLLGKTLFDRVQAVLKGKSNTQSQRHDFLYRRTLACASCHYSLIGERQKGHVYYRCHTKNCPQPAFREEMIKAEVSQFFQKIQFYDQERTYFKSRLMALRTTWASRQDEETKSFNLQLNQIKDRLNRLTDAYLDQALDKTMFEQRKKSLLLEQKGLEENLAHLKANEGSSLNPLEIFLELAGDAWLSHQLATPPDARKLLNIFTSNRLATGKKIEFKPSIVIQDIVNRPKNDGCGPERDIPRTWDAILEKLIALNTRGELPDLSVVSGFKGSDGDVKNPSNETKPFHSGRTDGSCS